MEHFLTKKAQPVWLLRLAEGLLIPPLLVWLAAGVYVFFDKYIHELNFGVLIAYIVLFALPLAVLCLILRTWLRRRNARKIASALAWETEGVIPWAQLDDHADVRDSQRMVEKLWAKGYLCNIEPDFEKLTLNREAAEGNPAGKTALQARKCAMCGAPLEKRTWGDWACRHCGTVAGK